MNHTEQFNEIMKRNAPAKKEKAQPVKVQLIGARDNMNAMQSDLAKCEICGNQVSLPFERLDNYDHVRTALLNAGAKYSRSKFIFPNDAAPYIDRLMGGENVNIKKEFQFYATPPGLAKYLVSIAAIEDHMICRILEPSAGQGAIVKAIYEKHWQRHKQIDCFELSEINRSVLEKIEGVHIIGNDFLDGMHYTNYYDYIIANPPFTKNSDVDHIRKMYEVCKPGGRIVTIASNSWRTGSQKKQVEFRDWLDDIGATVEDVGAGAFKESGTNIASCIIVINK